MALWFYIILEILVNTGSGHGLLPDSPKTSPEPMSTQYSFGGNVYINTQDINPQVVSEIYTRMWNHNHIFHGSVSQFSDITGHQIIIIIDNVPILLWCDCFLSVLTNRNVMEYIQKLLTVTYKNAIICKYQIRIEQMDVFVQERSNSSALAMELHLYCSKPSKYRQ